MSIYGDGMLMSVGGLLAVFEGPLGVSVDESDKGSSFQMYFERGRYQRPDAPLDSLHVLGKYEVPLLGPQWCCQPHCLVCDR